MSVVSDSAAFQNNVDKNINVYIQLLKGSYPSSMSRKSYATGAWVTNECLCHNPC